MKNNKAHLNIDLEFLDDRDSPKTKPSKAPPKNEKRSCQQCGAKAEVDEKFCTECGVKLKNSEDHARTAKPASTVYKYKWKNILLIGGGIFLFFVWLVVADSDGSSSSTNSTYTPPAANNDFLAGEEGQTFRCSDNNYIRAVALKPSAAESALLDSRISALKAESARIDAMYVDNTSQASIDRYNAVINSFNAKNSRLKSDLATWDQSIDTFNNFLDANCSPQ